MKKTVLIIISVLFPFFLFSQEQIPDEEKSPNLNNIQLDIGSYGLCLSVHYERTLINYGNFSTAGRFGITQQNFGPSTLEHKVIYLPIELIELYSFQNHHLEFGLGFIISNHFDYLNWDDGNWTIFDKLTGRIGYRYQKPGGKVLFRIGYTPYLISIRVYEGYSNTLKYDYKYLNSIGVSVGYSF